MANPPITLLVLEQSAHCDWDWQQTFEQYFLKGYGTGSAVETILDTAIDYVTNTPGYTYVFCEVGYLRRYFDSKPSSFANWQAAIANGTFQFSSGGITSAENLLTHGEAFIRNYLLGRQWLKKAFNVTASLRMWVPDDFGHDAQLPIVLMAMGYTGVGFWRIPVDGPQTPPGSAFIGGQPYTVTASASAPSSFLVAGDTPIGVDYIWQAADGSTVQAHWLMNGYNEGWQELGKNTDDPQPSGLRKAVNSYANLTKNGIAFVPIDNDFELPFDNLPSALAGWKHDAVPTQLSTFDDFLTQANVNLPTVQSNPTDGSYPYLPHPFWSGCYASQPLLKLLHYTVVRQLMLTEAMEVFLELAGKFDPNYANIAQSARERVQLAWETTMPSTHHDYITGTAPTSDPENVYLEQKDRLDLAIRLADDAELFVLTYLARAINLDNKTFGAPFAVFNATGAPCNQRLVSIATDQGESFLSSTIDGQRYTPIQRIPGGVLALADIPPFGYQTIWLTTTPATERFPMSVTYNDTDDSYTLANSYLSATISVDGITALYDLVANSANLFPGGSGNALVYYEDTGSIYRFASEVPWLLHMRFKPVTATSQLTIECLAYEGDTLGISVKVSGSVTVNGEAPVDLTIVYTLVVNEPYLRVSTTSTAPGGSDFGSTGYSVMVSFPFATASSPITELAYGTSAHWDKRAPRSWYDWSPSVPTGEFDFMTFEPVHEYVIPYGASGALGAIYPLSTPAWAISADGSSLYGCILRNTPNTAGNGAWGSDTDPHTVTYAVRVPSGLGDPSTVGKSSPLVEALQLHNPPVAMAMPYETEELIPPFSSLAVTREGANVLVTAAKAGTVDDTQLILRVYQPSNGTAEDAIVFPPLVASVYALNTATAVTALEDAPATNVVVGHSEKEINVTMNNAIATIALSKNP